MATRGFEFDSMLDRSNATPRQWDFTLGVTADHLVGDLMVMPSDGYIDAVTSTTTEVTCVLSESVASADVTAGTTKCKGYIITPNQVWRCSMDAATTALEVGTKTVDTADKNTISATDETGGKIILLDTSELDDDGNVMAKIVFSDVTFGIQA
ncbi:MAG TPA: hypothetical protein VM537_17895 [Anaerolineae bacterium]|nr:hypothetical protein [Anaerolineae bacterium]